MGLRQVPRLKRPEACTHKCQFPYRRHQSVPWKTQGAQAAWASPDTSHMRSCTCPPQRRHSWACTRNHSAGPVQGYIPPPRRRRTGTSTRQWWSVGSLSARAEADTLSARRGCNLHGILKTGVNYLGHLHPRHRHHRRACVVYSHYPFVVLLIFLIYYMYLL